MIIRKGIVSRPFIGGGWYAEIRGDSEAGGFFYLTISNSCEQFIFWGTTELSLIQQAINDNIEIEWIK